MQMKPKTCGEDQAEKDSQDSQHREGSKDDKDEKAEKTMLEHSKGVRRARLYERARPWLAMDRSKGSLDQTTKNNMILVKYSCCSVRVVTRYSTRSALVFYSYWCFAGAVLMLYSRRVGVLF